jgi:hypothetical protein
VGGGFNGCGDLREVQVHRFGIAGRQDQGCALASLRAKRPLKPWKTIGKRQLPRQSRCASK